MTCFIKNEEWAVCQPSCKLGNHTEDPVDFRTEWSCDVLMDNGTVVPFMTALQDPRAFIRVKKVDKIQV